MSSASAAGRASMEDPWPWLARASRSFTFPPTGSHLTSTPHRWPFVSQKVVLSPLLTVRGRPQWTGPSTGASRGRTRRVPARRAELLRIGGGEAGRLIFEPGWRWSGQVKPMEGTASCEAPQFQHHVSGVLAIGMDDGTELTAGPGDITALPSGHDAWVGRITALIGLFAILPRASPG